MEIFVNSGLHGVPWPAITVALVPPSVFGALLIARSEAGAHAERSLVDLIRASVFHHTAAGKFRPGSTVNIKVLQNNSPCDSCSGLYCSFQEELKQVCVMSGVRFTLEIVFSALYHIRRPSCASHNHTADPERHVRHVEGMRRLLQAGVFVRPFLDGDWAELASALIADTLRARQVEDFHLWADFRSVFGK